MKKIFSSLLIVCVLCCSILPAFAAAQSIVIDGTEAVIPTEMGEIMEKDDRTFVPVRFIMEYLGCGVTYNDESRFAVIADQTSTYMIQDGNNRLFKIPDGSSTAAVIQMDTNAFIVEYEDGGRMYVPIRFLAEAIGYTVGWDEATQTVTLDKAVTTEETQAPAADAEASAEETVPAGESPAA